MEDLEDFRDVDEFVEEDNDVDADLDEKIAEEHGKFLEVQARRREEVRASRPWSAPALSSPRPQSQRQREEEARTLSLVAQDKVAEPRSVFVPPERPYSLLNTPGGTSVSYLRPPRPQSADTVTRSHRLSQGSGVLRAGLQNIDENQPLEDEARTPGSKRPDKQASSPPTPDRSQAGGSDPGRWVVEPDWALSSSQVGSDAPSPSSKPSKGGAAGDQLSESNAYDDEDFDEEIAEDNSPSDGDAELGVDAAGTTHDAESAQAGSSSSSPAHVHEEPEAAEHPVVHDVLEVTLSMRNRDRGNEEGSHSEEPLVVVPTTSAAPVPPLHIGASIEPSRLHLDEEVGPPSPGSPPHQDLDQDPEPMDEKGMSHMSDYGDLLHPHAFAVQLLKHDLHTLPAHQKAVRQQSQSPPGTSGGSGGGSRSASLVQHGYLGFYNKDTARPGSASPGRGLLPGAAGGPAALAAAAAAASEAAQRPSSAPPRSRFPPDNLHRGHKPGALNRARPRSVVPSKPPPPLDLEGSECSEVDPQSIVQVSRTLRKQQQQDSAVETEAGPDEDLCQDQDADLAPGARPDDLQEGGGAGPTSLWYRDFRELQEGGSGTAGSVRDSMEQVMEAASRPSPWQQGGARPGSARVRPAQGRLMQRPASARPTVGRTHDPYTQQGGGHGGGMQRPFSAQPRGAAGAGLRDGPGMDLSFSQGAWAPPGRSVHTVNSTAAVDVGGVTVSVYVADTMKRIVEANRWLAAQGHSRRYRLKSHNSNMEVEVYEEPAMHMFAVGPDGDPLGELGLEPQAPPALRQLTLKQFLTAHTKLQKQAKQMGLGSRAGAAAGGGMGSPGGGWGSPGAGPGGIPRPLRPRPQSAHAGGYGQRSSGAGTSGRNGQASPTFGSYGGEPSYQAWGPSSASHSPQQQQAGYRPKSAAGRSGVASAGAEWGVEPRGSPPAAARGPHSAGYHAEQGGDGLGSPSRPFSMSELHEHLQHVVDHCQVISHEIGMMKAQPYA